MAELVDAAFFPLASWRSGGPLEIEDGVEVRQLRNGEMPDLWTYALNGQQIETIRQSAWWLHARRPDSELLEVQNLVEDVLIATEILLPFDLMNRVVFWNRPAGWAYTVTALADWRSTPLLRQTAWDCAKKIDACAVGNFARQVLAGVRAGGVRLRNTILLLQHGLEARNLHMRILFWTMALDCLLMASNGRVFGERLAGLLGRQARVFGLAEAPAARVGTVAKDLYELRSEIAHGQAISAKFQKCVGKRYRKASKRLEWPAGYQYRHLLEEVALSLVLKSLKLVFIRDYAHIIANPREWRKFLEDRAADVQVH